MTYYCWVLFGHLTFYSNLWTPKSHKLFSEIFKKFLLSDVLKLLYIRGPRYFGCWNLQFNLSANYKARKNKHILTHNGCFGIRGPQLPTNGKKKIVLNIIKVCERKVKFLLYRTNWLHFLNILPLIEKLLSSL